MKSKWLISNKSADFKAITEKFHISEVVARCLINKDIREYKDIDKFLNPKLEYMHNPLLMKDMKETCDILINKIHNNKKIRIIGDYDVDGIIATYILYYGLLKMGADVDYIIPDRIEDGYGINEKMVDNAYNEEIDTILTCDNGISAINQIKKAKEYGITVIITDHHDIIKENNQFILPEADAIINPKQEDCTYPFKSLCGGAIAYKLIEALETNFCKGIDLNHLLSFAAIATICDIMDLQDENRIIVKNGLDILRNTGNLGLNKLIEAVGISSEDLQVYHIGFIIGPCLNASGRLETATKGLRLLLTDSEEEATNLANELKELNDLRKDMTAKGVERAIDLIETTDLKEDKVLVVYIEDCHESLAGIIAGRIKDKYYKPTIVLTNSKDIAKGSARSIEEYNVYEEINKCKELLLRFGGHPMAAGLSIDRNKINEFRSFLNENTILTNEMLMPKVSIDVKLPLSYITEELIDELSILEPFGKGNAKPVFAQNDISIKSLALIGKKQNAIKFRIINEIGGQIDALYFGDVEGFFTYIENKYGIDEVDNMKNGRYINTKLTVTYYPTVNIFRNIKTLQIIIQDYR